MLSLIHHVLYRVLPQDVVQLIIANCIIPKFSIHWINDGLSMYVELIGVILKEPLLIYDHDGDLYTSLNLLECAKEIININSPNHGKYYKFDYQKIGVSYDHIDVISNNYNYTIPCGIEGRRSLAKAFRILNNAINLRYRYFSSRNKLGEDYKVDDYVLTFTQPNYCIKILDNRLLLSIDYYTVQFTCVIMSCKESLMNLDNIIYSGNDLKITTSYNRVEFNTGMINIIVSVGSLSCTYEVNFDTSNIPNIHITRLMDKSSPEKIVDLYNHLHKISRMILS